MIVNSACKISDLNLNKVLILLFMIEGNKIFFVLLLTIELLAQQENRKLIYAQEVFRHGARYPLRPSAKDLTNITDINVLQGQLTRQGKSQHYLLGQKLYQTYWEPLFGKGSKKYAQEKFYFKSTDVNRTIESLQSQLFGIFQNMDTDNITDSERSFSVPVWNETFDRKAGAVYEKSPYFIPLPIHVQKGPTTPWTHGDFLRTYSSQFCYKQLDWQSANRRDPYVLNINQNSNFTKAISLLGQALKQNLTFYDVHKYYESAQCLIYLGMKTLPILSEDTPTRRDIQAIFDLSEYIKNYYSEPQLRSISTGFFNETVNNFKKVTQSQEGVQWVFYSAHDTTICNFLARMDLANVRCIYENYLNGTVDSQYCIQHYPEFTTQLIFEVYHYPNNTNTMQIRYNGNLRRIPFCGYKWECDVEEFYKWYDSWKDQNWVKNCGIVNSTAQTYFSIIMIELE